MTREQVLASLPVNVASSSKELRDYAIQHRVQFDLKDSWNIVLHKIQQDALRKAGVAEESFFEHAASLVRQ